MHRLLVVPGATLALSACSLLTPLDDLQRDGGNPSATTTTGGGGEQGGGSSTGGNAMGGNQGTGGNGAGGSSSTGGSGPTNLLSNPGFESGSNGCGSGWSGGYGATQEQSSLAHSGDHSCLLCPELPDAGSYAVAPTNPLALTAGSYYAEAWIRAPESGPAAGLTGIVMSYTNAMGQMYFQGTQVGPDSDWIQSTLQFTLDTDEQLTFQVHIFDPLNGCVLTDDVALYAQ